MYLVSKTEPGQCKISVNYNLYNDRICKFVAYPIITWTPGWLGNEEAWCWRMEEKERNQDATFYTTLNAWENRLQEKSVNQTNVI